MLTSNDLATLRAIVDSTDPKVDVGHRLRAMELLAEVESSAAPEGALVLAEWVSSMTDAQVEIELADFVGRHYVESEAARLGVCTPPPHLQALVERGHDLDRREGDLRAREEAVEARERALQGAQGDAPGDAGRRGRGGL